MIISCIERGLIILKKTRVKRRTSLKDKALSSAAGESGGLGKNADKAKSSTDGPAKKIVKAINDANQKTEGVLKKI